jgi:hypothetical protein
MVKIVAKPDNLAVAATPPRILYFGQSADEICDLVSPHIGLMSIEYTERVNEALALARAHKIDVIIVDQRSSQATSQLILPLLHDLNYSFKLIVISVLSDVGDYLKMPSVARVLTAPLRATQLTRALGMDPTKKRHDTIKLAEEEKKEAEAPRAPRTSPLVWISNLGMQLVSTAYKRMAFVLLGILFLSFTFYGVMIGFFLTSSGWAAPQTLTRGHMLVDRMEKDIGDLRLALNMNKQRLVEAGQRAQDAERSAGEAQILVNFAGDTVSKEIVSRERQVRVIDQNIKRTEKVQRVFEKQMRSGGLSDDLAKLYGKHLIDRKTYTSNTLGLLETGQRMAGIESQLDILNSDRAQLSTQLSMLHSLKTQLKQTGPMSDITAASSDLLLLTKQALDARAAYDTARNEFEVSTKTRQTLLNSQTVIQKQIINMESSTLGRAISERVDVLFVPYGNEAQFKEGTPLYTCKFTMFYCWKAGTVGQVLPGEIASVHPFFGKPIRGFFVEALLTDIQAATREIIHAGHAPLYF